jgi:predicted Rossmann fold flavoprotein
MNKFNTVVIGAGAAGIVAGISAKRKGDSVVICESMPRIGKKILASGNGRCNLLNENLDESFYNKTARNLVKSVFTKYGKNEILRFFKELGLETYSEDGRIFPITNQASSVLKVLEMEIVRLGIQVELNFKVDKILYSKGKFLIKSKGRTDIECERLIISGGGKSYPSLGSDGSCYDLARQLGHKIIEPVPAAVPLLIKDKLCHLLQGQKIFAKVKAVIDGKEVCESRGDLLFTKYGLSGTSIIDVSEEVSVAINREKKDHVFVAVDMVPFMEPAILEDEITKRVEREIPPEELVAGILPNKFGWALKEQLSKDNTEDIVVSLKKRLFKVLGTRGWNEAEFTSGGIDLTEIKEYTLESRLIDSLYFIGEILDVCGKRCGYNLAWAWASGLAAGSAE